MPSHAWAAVSSADGMAKIWSAGAATVFAIRTFLPSPMMNRRTPYAKSSMPTRRSASWSAISPVADDRAGDQLRKQEQVQRGVDRALLRPGITPIDVHDVRDRVEGEEGDADGQQDARHDDGTRVQDEEERVDVVREEIRVFENTSTSRFTPTAAASRRSARGG